ncbi:MAG: 3-ketoacyl-ACP reductase [Geminicoccaceae bacterium]|nr:MAG: 3-ketoacyl-ACP reductase [Geminicoccaceae bacterium]
MNGVALVTGGRRGIGRAIALALAREGFAVAVNAEVDAPDLHATVDDVQALGVPAMPVVLDVADVAGHEAVLALIEAELGPLTTLINNAGVGALHRGDPLDVSPESFDRCLAINARAPFFLGQAFAKRLLARARAPEQHHCIVTITSANAVAVALNRAEYAISKAAASMATRSLAARLGAEGINVYEVQPGVIATDMTAPALAAYAARIEQGFTLTRRVGQPEDVAEVVALLATGRLAYCTGQAIPVDGGLSVARF